MCVCICIYLFCTQWGLIYTQRPCYCPEIWHRDGAVHERNWGQHRIAHLKLFFPTSRDVKSGKAGFVQPRSSAWPWCLPRGAALKVKSCRLTCRRKLFSVFVWRTPEEWDIPVPCNNVLIVWWRPCAVQCLTLCYLGLSAGCVEQCVGWRLLFSFVFLHFQLLKSY